MPNKTTMPITDEEKTRKVNLDEIEPDSTGAAETGGDDPECPDSPTGQHEFDTDEDSELETCVYCGENKN